MKHTKETLKNYMQNEKQLFFCEENGKVLRAKEIDALRDDVTIYPVLKTRLDCGIDIPFNEGYNNELAAKNLWAISVGAFPNKKSPTGFVSFDGLPCKTANQIMIYLKKLKQEMSENMTGKLFAIYSSALKYLSICKVEDFERSDELRQLAESCRALQCKK